MIDDRLLLEFEDFVMSKLRKFERDLGWEALEPVPDSVSETMLEMLAVWKTDFETIYRVRVRALTEVGSRQTWVEIWESSSQSE